MRPKFIAALFTVAKSWGHPTGPSVGEWVEMWLCTPWTVPQPLKKNEILPLATTWMDPEGVV